MCVGHYHGSHGIETKGHGEDQDAVGLTSILNRGLFLDKSFDLFDLDFASME